jgi:hypothetical protein
MDGGDPVEPPAADLHHAPAPVELVARLPKNVTVTDFTDACPAVQQLILAKASVAFVDDFAASQLPVPPPDVGVSLPAGVTWEEFSNASSPVQQIIRAASTVTKKRQRSTDVGCMVVRSAAQLQARVLSSCHGADRLRDELLVVTAVCHTNVRDATSAKQPTRFVPAATSCV